MLNSRDKGARGEREFSDLCKYKGYHNCRRGQQFSGIEGNDVVGLPFIHIEVKRVQALNIEKAMAQSRRDAKEGEIPIVAFRRNREKWKVCMDAEDWFKLYREFERMAMMTNTCPECGSKLIHEGGCVRCSNPICGWSPCKG